MVSKAGLEAYVMNIYKHAGMPESSFDRPSFERGFTSLDFDGDGLISYEDILQFTKLRMNDRVTVPGWFLAYQKSARESR